MTKNFPENADIFKFTDRNKEQERLANDLLNGVHVWIDAHHLFGKSTLVSSAIERLSDTNKIVWSNCNLRLIHDIPSTCRTLTHTIQNLIAQVILSRYTLDQVMSQLPAISAHISQNCGFTPVISIDKDELTATLNTEMSVSSLKTAMINLDVLAKHYDCKVALMLSDFQELNKFDRNLDLNSLLAEVIDCTTGITFVFAGSERKNMEQSFLDVTRPLHQKVKRFILNRHSLTAYRRHLNRLSNATWGNSLSQSVCDTIIMNTDRHPYYLGVLCSSLWCLKSLPTKANVEVLWKKILQYSLNENTAELRSLSPNDKKVLLGIVDGVNTEMTSAKTSFDLGMAVSSISATLDSLMKRDIIEKSKAGYFIVNPTMIGLLI